MSAIAATATVAEEISLTQEVSDALDALDLSEDSQDVSDTEEEDSDAEEEDSEDAKEDAMNVVSSDSYSSTKEAVAQARRRISIQKSTLKAIQKAIRRDEEGATRIQCRVLKARAAHQAAELRLTIGCVTRTKQSRVETTRHRLEGVQQELYEMDERVRSLRRSLQEAHDRLPVLQLELEGARHAHKEAGRLRAKQRQQLYREQRLYQKERHAIGHLHPATESSEALSLCVKLLSGDLLTVEVHSADPVELLPRQFAEQHGYHLGVIPQMTFHLSHEDRDAEESEKSEEPFVTGTTHLRGTRRTWKELFPESEPPMLLFLLKESHDYSRAEKLRLIHDILRRRQLAAMMEDDDLWSLYHAWNIHCSVHLDANRWQKLSAFVEDHLPHFVPLTEEMIREKQRRERRATRLMAEEGIAQRTSEETRQTLLRYVEELRPFFPASYPPLPASPFRHRIHDIRDSLQHLLEVCRRRQSTLSESGVHLILYTFHRYFPLSHLAELGFPPSSFCDCHDDSCYICHYDQDSLETPQ